MNEIKTGWLTITRKCNNFCEWCYTQKKLNCEIMTKEDAFSSVNKLKELGAKRIVLIGGEPTLYDGLDELIKYIVSKNIKVSIATNGRKFSDIEFAKKIIESGVSSINISLKGTSELEYVKYTKSKGLNEAIKGYNNLLGLNFKNVSLSYVIVNDDKEHFDELVDLIEKEKLKNIVFQFVKPVLEIKSKNDIVDVKKLGKFVTYIYKKMKTTTTNYCLEISFPLCSVDSNILEKMINENRIITCCHVPTGKGLILDTDLKVLPCNHFAEFPYSEEPIGKLSAQQISDFLDSDICVKLRNTAGSYPSEICANCDKWSICGGGCFTRWFYQEPNSLIEELNGGEKNGIN